LPSYTPSPLPKAHSFPSHLKLILSCFITKKNITILFDHHEKHQDQSVIISDGGYELQWLPSAAKGVQRDMRIEVVSALDPHP
jgi:hypothetical protein